MASWRTIRRTGKIWKEITKALYPFKDTWVVRFAPSGSIQKLGKPYSPNLYEATLLQLPQNMIRRFVWYGESGEEPNEKEFAKWRRQLLGTARRTLYSEQVRRIKELPHLPGRGREKPSPEKCKKIRQKFEALKKNEEFETATEVVRAIAQLEGYKERNIWRILRRTRRS